MKNLLVFILLFLSSVCKITACGYTPYGEDVRYCLFSPKYFNFKEYSGFYYNNFLWGFDTMNDSFSDKITYESNILDWYRYTKKKVSLEEIVAFNNQLKFTDIHPGNPNAFVQFLYKNHRNDVLKYFRYAKKCEDFNGYMGNNTWERSEDYKEASAAKFSAELYRAYQTEKNLMLKRKYAFQCIRLAYYHGDMATVNRVFHEAFAKAPKDYVYYWSLYFYCFGHNAKGNYNDIAELFAYCPEKAFPSQFYFNSEFNLNTALSFAKTPEQIANLYAYASPRIITKNLDKLKIIYQNKPKFRTLDFLLLREINKLEDWIYTPYYTNYSPSIEQEDYYSESEASKITTLTLRARSDKDRLYAQEVLHFVQQADMRKVDNPALWKAAEIQLLFMIQQYDLALAAIKTFERQYPHEKVSAEVAMMKALCLTARQPFGKAVIVNEVQEIIKLHSDNRRFIFALGRELEFKDNLLDGLALISHLNHVWSEIGSNADDVEWRGNRLLTSDNLDVFYNYFDYLDFVYAARDLQTIVNGLNRLSPEQKRNQIYQVLLHDKDYLTDLLGTKYIREEQLGRALLTFRSIRKSYWEENYNAWERGRFDEYLEFDSNPFYTLKYTPDFIPRKEKYFVNKLTITEHLIKYLRLANDVNCKDRDYYYFLIGNCYLNMTDMGNSWMMRRYSSYTSYDDTYLNESYIDNLEYRTRIKTTLYYELAYQNAKTDKFKALCLHMMDYAQKQSGGKTGRVIREYPQYFNELSNCIALSTYFNAR